MSSEKLEALMWRYIDTAAVQVSPCVYLHADSYDHADSFVKRHNTDVNAAHAIGVEEGSHADIVAARIEGLREGAKIAREQFFMTDVGSGYLAGERPCWDDVEPAINARIAELEAAAPEVSEMRAKAEAFDVAMAEFERSCSDDDWWFIEQMTKALAEAKRKGAGT